MNASNAWVGMVVFAAMSGAAGASDLKAPLHLSAHFKDRQQIVEKMLSEKYPGAAGIELDALEKGGLSQDEVFVTKLLRVKVYQGLGLLEKATKAIEVVLTYEKLSDEKAAVTSKELGFTYAEFKNYPIAACWLELYVDLGGADEEPIRMLKNVHKIIGASTLDASGKFGRTASKCEAL